jgi:hypothetical protein
MNRVLAPHRRCRWSTITPYVPVSSADGLAVLSESAFNNGLWPQLRPTGGLSAARPRLDDLVAFGLSARRGTKPPPFFAPIKGVPQRADERVGQIAGPPDDRRGTPPTEPDHYPGREKPDECAADDVAWVVEPHEDAGESEDRGSRQEQSSHPPADEHDRERDREGSNGVIARKGRLVRGSNEKERIPGMSDERSRTLPEVRDELADEQPQPGRREPGEASDLPPIVGARTVEEPKPDCGEHEGRHGPELDEVLDLVSDQAMSAQRPVEEVEDGPVDWRSLAAWVETGGSRHRSGNLLTRADGRSRAAAPRVPGRHLGGRPWTTASEDSPSRIRREGTVVRRAGRPMSARPDWSASGAARVRPSPVPTGAEDQRNACDGIRIPRLVARQAGSPGQATNERLGPADPFLFVRPATSRLTKFPFAGIWPISQRVTVGPRRASLRLVGQLIVPICRRFEGGSDGTRTCDLRRDRPSYAPRRLATNSSERPHLQGIVTHQSARCRMVEPIVQSTFGPRLGHEIVSQQTTLSWKNCRVEASYLAWDRIWTRIRKGGGTRRSRTWHYRVRSP